MTLYPSPEKQGEIKFVFAKSLPYGTRMSAAICLLVLGVVTQVFGDFWIGWAMLAAGMGLGLIRGYHASIPVHQETEKWNPVTPDEFKKVNRKASALAAWDVDAFDITNPLGVVAFIFLLIGAGAGLAIASQHGLEVYWLADCAIVLAPHWFIGIRRYLKKDKLILKIDLLEHLMSFLAPLSQVQVLPMLSTVEGASGGRVPNDARLMARFIGAPDWWLGLQIQICINSVQGHDYPYLYCVLLAKPVANMPDLLSQLSLAPQPKLTIEPCSQADVDVIVVRQTTSKKTGYHTKPRDAERIVTSALEIAQRVLGLKPA